MTRVRVVGLFLVAVCLSGYLCLAQQASPDKEEKAAKLVYVIPVRDDIMLGLTTFIDRVVDEAINAGADLIVVPIDSPGGRIDAMLQICESLERPDIPVYAYIENSALSAAALVALTCERIYASPSSSMGAATPINISSGEAKAVGEKYVSFVRAEFRKRAQMNGYSEHLAEAMVDKDIEVTMVTVDDKVEFMVPRELDSKRSLPEYKHAKFEKVIEEGKLLTLTTQEAQKYGFITDTAEGLEELLQSLELGDAEVVELSPNWSEEVARFLTNPVIASLLLTVGLICIYVELKAPGFGAPGIIGILCFAVLLFGGYTAKLANVIDITLVMIGIALLLTEIFFIPGFGITGIAGLILIFVGLLLSMQDFVIPDPEFPWELDRLWINTAVVFGSTGASLVACAVLAHFLPDIPLLRRLIHVGTMGAQRGFTATSADCSDLIGKQAIAVTRLRPAGKIEVDDEVFDAMAEGNVIDAGSKVEIIEVKGNRTVVKEI